MNQKISLKDELFNPEKVNLIASQIKLVYPSFEQEAFEYKVLNCFDTLELKERITHISLALYFYLPSNYKEACTILLKALPPELDKSKTDNDFGDFIYAPYSEFVMRYGCTKEVLAFSLEALREMTKRFSVEFSIREFINCYPKETLLMLEKCANSSNYHERRLASEGTRPKLPWAKKLMISHDTPLFLLHQLYADKTRYVTRSVANHLNDIAKIDASLVLKTLKEWQKSSKQNSKEMEFILNHALRTLVKEGNQDALELLGYKAKPKIVVSCLRLEREEVSIGEALCFEITIEAKEELHLMVDYLIHFKNKKGELRPKVYKLKKFKIQKGENLKLTKKHFFKANMTTRKFYIGEHRVGVQINGVRYDEVGFFLKTQN